jgi:hypothetical protein
MAASCAAVAREAAASNLDYLAFLTVLCGQEVAQREQTQAARRLVQAQFPWPKTLDEFDFSVAPSVKQAAILQLASGAFVRGYENWLVLGGPGVGKTHLLCGVGRALCQQGFRVRFRSAAALVNELLLADKEHRLPSLSRSQISRRGWINSSDDAIVAFDGPRQEPCHPIQTKAPARHTAWTAPHDPQLHPLQPAPHVHQQQRQRHQQAAQRGTGRGGPGTHLRPEPVTALDSKPSPLAFAHA